VLARIADRIDSIAMDVKAPLALYQKITGTPIRQEDLEMSIRLVKEAVRDGEFRTTVIEGIHKLDEAVDLCRPLLQAKRYVVQPFVPRAELLDRDYTRISRTQREFLREWGDRCRAVLPGTEIDIRM